MRTICCLDGLAGASLIGIKGSSRRFEQNRVTVVHTHICSCPDSNRVGAITFGDGLTSPPTRQVDGSSIGPGAFPDTKVWKHLSSPNLPKRNFKPTAIDQVWCGDVTGLLIEKRWIHLAIVTDLYASCVIGWAFSLVNDANLVSEALRMAKAVRARPLGLMSRSDQGGEYTNCKSLEELRRYGILQSMNHLGQCWNMLPQNVFSPHWSQSGLLEMATA